MRQMVFVFWAVAALAGGMGGKAEYVGGTIEAFKEKTDGRINATDRVEFEFATKGQKVRVPYERINQLEYGQKVDRRYVTAVLLSPLFLLAKTRKHFLTVGYEDAAGQQQAMIFQVSKGDVRAVLVGLEARTGRKITFQDEEARKAGKG
jgi:hypothetical protein